MSGALFNKTIIDDIRNKYTKIKNFDDTLSLLNFIDLKTNQSNKKLPALTINYLYNLSKSKHKRYIEFEILKKNGNKRLINSPEPHLKRVQFLLNLMFQSVFEPTSHYSSNGFIIGRDIKRNAEPHVNKNYVLNIDIKDFFPSINFRRVKVVLELEPFNLKEEKDFIGFVFANLCVYNNSLPQGAPTSPIVSNIVTQRLDRKLTKFSIKKGVKYTRYADDLTFSCNKKVFTRKFISEVNKILLEENFIMNDEKTRIRSHMDRQEVTGLIVNEKVNVKREFLQKTRAMLNNWEKGGLIYARKKFEKFQQKDNANFKNVLQGNIAFLKLIKGEENHVIKRLQLKFIYLNNLINYDYIVDERVRNRLISDNKSMERIFFQTKNDPNEDFIKFCTSAFHQIENLINYYYYKKFQDFQDLLIELLNHNPSFKKRYKNLPAAKQSFKKIKDLNINVLVFLYEKEFFFDKDIYYDKHITMLREIRNDDSHRCSIINLDVIDLKNKYSSIREEEKEKKKRRKQFIPTPNQIKTILNYRTLIFLQEKKYNDVRKKLKVISNNIKKSICLDYSKRLPSSPQ